MGYTIIVKGVEGESVASLENISYAEAIVTIARIGLEFKDEIEADIISVELKKTNKDKEKQ